jgi:hypothetical protein
LRIEFIEARQNARFADRFREFIERGVADPFVKISFITGDENGYLDLRAVKSFSRLPDPLAPDCLMIAGTGQPFDFQKTTLARFKAR